MTGKCLLFGKKSTQWSKRYRQAKQSSQAQLPCEPASFVFCRLQAPALPSELLWQPLTVQIRQNKAGGTCL
jgi:hypothetical protein